MNDPALGAGACAKTAPKPSCSHCTLFAIRFLALVPASAGEVSVHDVLCIMRCKPFLLDFAETLPRRRFTATYKVYSIMAYSLQKLDPMFKSNAEDHGH